MHKARAFFLVCAGFFLLALAYHLGARSAHGKAGVESPLVKFRSLVKLCDSDDPTASAACGAYITGFAHGINAAQMSDITRAVAEDVMNGNVAPTDEAMAAAGEKLEKKWRLYCIRSRWTAGFVQSVLVQYSREHPTALDDMPKDHMLAIFERAFPCGEQPSRQR
jgi:hypothetical protein